jgi:hypothetical protein
MNRVKRVRKILKEVPEGTLFVEAGGSGILGLSVVYIKQINPGGVQSVAQIVHCYADLYMNGKAVSLQTINDESEICLVELTELQGIIPIVSYQQLQQFLASQTA